jgi:HSP20 family protein
MSSETVRALQALFLPALRTGAEHPWQPPADVYRVADGWLLKFELAGVAPEDVTVRVEGRRVVVRGARLDRCLECGCSVHQLEIAYSTFERWVELPDDLDPADVRCEFVHGMLLVRVHQGPAR